MPDTGISLPPAAVAASADRWRISARDALLGILFLCVYLALDRISYLDALRPFAIMAWNPALGVCVAAAALGGRKVLPLIFIAPLMAALVTRGFPLTPLYTLGVGVLTLCKVVLTVGGAAFIASRLRNDLLRDRQAALLLAAVPATAVMGAVHVIALIVAGLLPESDGLDVVFRLWIGDLIGIFVQTPFCFLLLRLAGSRPRLTLRTAVEVALQACLVGAAVWFIFGVHRSDASDYFYLLFLPMIWIVISHGLAGAVVLNMAVQATTISYLLATGPTATDRLFFQALAVVLVVSSLALGVSVAHSRAAMQRLRHREQEVSASMKVAATSQLAGALAHELSHPIGAISNYTGAMEHLAAHGRATEGADILHKLQREARRATETLHRLRDFYRTGALAMERLDLGDLIREMAALLSAKLEAQSISLRLSLPGGGVSVLGDRVQLLGVLHNLMVNAVDALAATPEHQRFIAVSVTRSAGSVRIFVEDSGPGIAQDIRGQIFESFTTTKRDGLGLGLAMSQSVVQAHGGQIEPGDSSLGGARFTVSLPAGLTEGEP